MFQLTSDKLIESATTRWDLAAALGATAEVDRIHRVLPHLVMTGPRSSLYKQTRTTTTTTSTTTTTEMTKRMIKAAVAPKAATATRLLVVSWKQPTPPPPTIATTRPAALPITRPLLHPPKPSSAATPMRSIATVSPQPNNVSCFLFFLSVFFFRLADNPAHHREMHYCCRRRRVRKDM